MYHGIINVYKEAGFTSHDVVAKLRGICKQKKIGHTGTLDPDATGVLPVCLGSATRVCDLLTDKSKEYEAVLRLGITTDTQDLTGTVLTENRSAADAVTIEQAKEAVYSFVGEYDQIPPMYSALKVNGKKLYELARQGKEVERMARRIEITKIEILQMDLPDIRFRVGCSKGTYIRTLCYDIGRKLGCGAAMVSLTRTRVGDFTLEQTHTLSELAELATQERLSELILPVDQIFKELQSIEVKADCQKYLDNGNKLTLQMLMEEALRIQDTEQVRVYSENHYFYGVYQYVESDRVFIPVKMFFTER